MRDIKAWVEGFAQKPYALWALFAISFIEASVFPLPPDVLLIALGVVSPRKALKYGLVTAAGSFLGGYLGYYIGYASFEIIGKPILSFFRVIHFVDPALRGYQQHGILALIFAGFTPIPYIAFTMAAGFNRTIDLLTLTIGGAIGRLLRFMLVGGLLYVFGPPVKTFIDKYFEKVSIVFAGLLVVLIIAFKFLL